MRSADTRRTSGVTIAEAVLATALLALSFAGLFSVSGQSLKLLRAGTIQSAATVCLEQRIEEIRTLTWDQIVDASYLRDNVLNAAPSAATPLPDPVEQIAVNSYPTATAPTVVVRPAAGGAVVQSLNSALSTAKMLRIDVQISWPDANGSTDARQITTVVTKGGIIR